MADQAKEIWLNEPQVEALVGPRTREVFEAFMRLGELAVADVQKHVRFPSKSIYYQIKKLLAVGLLVEGGNDAARGATYRPVASKIRVPSGYQGERYESLAAKGVSALLRRSQRGFEAAAAASPAEPELVDYLLFYTGRVRIGAEALKEFGDRYRALLEEFSTSDDKGDTRLVSTLLVVHPELDAAD